MRRAVLFASRTVLLAASLGGASARVVHAQAATSTAPTATAATTASGADAELERRVRALSARLRCPVCQGESIQDSPAELSREMRDIVREQLAAGRSPAEVEQFFVARYGEWILLEPEARGVNLLVYLLPPLALVLGGVVVVMAVRRWTGDPREPADARSG